MQLIIIPSSISANLVIGRIMFFKYRKVFIFDAAAAKFRRFIDAVNFRAELVKFSIQRKTVTVGTCAVKAARQQVWKMRSYWRNWNI